MPMRAWSIGPDGLRIALRVTPKARRAAIGPVQERPDGARLQIAVQAPPEDGKANAAVVALLADALGVPKGRIDVIQGAAGRLKLVSVGGDGQALADRLAALLSAPSTGRRR